MYKLTIILSILIFASAKTTYLKNDLENVDKVLPIRKLNHDGIWVLNFNNDFDLNPLRPPTKGELRIFKNSVAPVIKQNQVINNDKEGGTHFNDVEHISSPGTQDKNNSTLKEIQLELKKIINKFLQSITVVDPSQSVNKKKDKQPSLKIYFKGNSSALVLQSGHFRNVYFNESEYGLLPKWFFEEHFNIGHDLNGDFVSIPQAVKTEFYNDLLHLVITLYGHVI